MPSFSPTCSAESRGPSWRDGAHGGSWPPSWGRSGLQEQGQAGGCAPWPPRQGAGAMAPLSALDASCKVLAIPQKTGHTLLGWACRAEQVRGSGCAAFGRTHRINGARATAVHGSRQIKGMVIIAQCPLQDPRAQRKARRCGQRKQTQPRAAAKGSAATCRAPASWNRTEPPAVTKRRRQRRLKLCWRAASARAPSSPLARTRMNTVRSLAAAATSSMKASAGRGRP